MHAFGHVTQDLCAWTHTLEKGTLTFRFQKHRLRTLPKLDSSSVTHRRIL